MNTQDRTIRDEIKEILNDNGIGGTLEEIVTKDLLYLFKQPEKQEVSFNEDDFNIQIDRFHIGNDVINITKNGVYKNSHLIIEGNLKNPESEFLEGFISNMVLEIPEKQEIEIAEEQVINYLDKAKKILKSNMASIYSHGDFYGATIEIAKMLQQETVNKLLKE